MQTEVISPDQGNTGFIGQNGIPRAVQPLNQVPLIQPFLKHIEARQPVVNADGTYGRLVRDVSGIIAENVGVSTEQAQVIEKMLLALIKNQLRESQWFWFEINVRSTQMWSIEQDARRVLGKDIGIFMKNTVSNYRLLQKKLAEKGPRYKYLLQYYNIYHAYVLDPIYALSACCQIPAWIPIEGEAGASKKIMLYCVIQLYPRIFYEDFSRNVLWRKGGVLIETMTYNDEQGVWFRTPEGSSNATKIELAWFESSF